MTYTFGETKDPGTDSFRTFAEYITILLQFGHLYFDIFQESTFQLMKLSERKREDDIIERSHIVDAIN